MTRKQFIPIDLSILEEGVFLEDMNKALQTLSSDLLEFVERHGADKAKGTKARLNVQLTICAHDPSQDLYAITIEKLDPIVPGRPKTVSLAVADFTQSIPPVHTLFVRSTGSTADDPRQMHIPMDNDETQESEHGTE